MSEILVSTDWLQSHLQDSDIRIIDSRWVLGKLGEGKRLYEEGHIPGAIHLDIEEHLSGKEGPGRHPIPKKRDFENVMSEMGVSRDKHIIVYDDGKGAPAARLWWLFRYFGHEFVSVLDGGWNLWVREMKTTEREVRRYQAQKYTARAKHPMVLDKEGVDSLRDDPQVQLLDARAPERFRGDLEPLDAKAGHIPGAENFPYTQTLDPETGKFLSPEKLKEVFQKMGTDKAETVICYCGSGVTACTNILALKLIGIEAKLYEGSWSDWSKDSGLSIATK